MTKLPEWWPTWIPETCSNGHELGPGKINQSWVHCSCAGAEFNGHHVQRCRIDGCRWELWPPEHVGPEPSGR